MKHEEISFREQFRPCVGDPSPHFYEELIFALPTFFTSPERPDTRRKTLFTLICAASGTAFHRLAGVLRVPFCAGMPRKTVDFGSIEAASVTAFCAGGFCP
jgi:hypothetical protein